MGVADAVLGPATIILRKGDHGRVNVHPDDLAFAARSHLLGDHPRTAADVQHSFRPQQVDPPVELIAHRPRPAGLTSELSVPFLDCEV